MVRKFFTLFLVSIMSFTSLIASEESDERSTKRRRIDQAPSEELNISSEPTGHPQSKES